MEDSKGSKKLALELFVLLRLDVFTIQPDLLTQSVATALYSFVIGSVLQLLYMD